ncbi:hypothetical protein EBS80_01985 [bacterium]|nr:hypothetical protein [bacterium]
MGSSEPPVDSAHCYALRRALLNSPRFERNRLRVVWTRLFVYTGTLVAGGAVAAILVVNVLTVELAPSASTVAPSVVRGQIVPQLVEAERPSSIEFASYTDQNVRHALEFAKPDIQFAVSR